MEVLVNIAEDNVLYGVVLEDFMLDYLQLPIPSSGSRETGDHLQVPAYVHARRRGGTRGLTLGALDDAVQDKHLPESFGLEGEDVLAMVQ